MCDFRFGCGRESTHRQVNEVEMNLSEAMRHKKIKSFKTDWSLEELNDNWTSETFDVVDEEDEMTLDDYYVP